MPMIENIHAIDQVCFPKDKTKKKIKRMKEINAGYSETSPAGRLWLRVRFITGQHDSTCWVQNGSHFYELLHARYIKNPATRVQHKAFSINQNSSCCKQAQSGFNSPSFNVTKQTVS